MAKQIDQILVIDVEATCWDTPPPDGQKSDIIEIGICTIDIQTLERLEKTSILVKPARSEISEFCTQLTTLTPDMFTDAYDLKTAVQILIDRFDSKKRLFASWGDYDRRQFEKNCRDMNLQYPFGPTHLNVKNLFAVSLGLQKEAGMDKACEIMNMPIEGTHHRGIDDAWNIAGILRSLLKSARKNFKFF